MQDGFDRDYNKAFPPYPYKSEAITEYHIKGKQKFIEISELKQLPYAAYP